MTRLYDNDQPTIIDEPLLLKTITDQTESEQNELSKEDFQDVVSVRMNYKKILKIDNLAALSNLTKLQLDNNIIERIENLDVLQNLKWLDLSFNNIEFIEGLDKLTKLTDLTLFNNRIKKIENMDKLTNLNIFSVGNNNIEAIEDAIYLRQFKHLKSLNIKGNPVCKVKNYHAIIVSHLASLTYLNFRLVDSNARRQAQEEFADEIGELENQERADERALVAKQKSENDHDMYLKANIKGFGGGHVFADMYAEDQEVPKLMVLEGYEEMREQYKEKVLAICNEMTTTALEHHGIIEEEKRQFHEATSRAKDANTQRAVALINTMQVKSKEIIRSGMAEMRVEESGELIDTLERQLMGLETELVEQLEDVVKEYERNMTDLSAAALEPIQSFITQLRELEQEHHDEVSAVANDTIEAFIKGDIKGNISEEMRQFFIDKDTMNNVLQSSHDCHLQKIDNHEDEIVQRSSKRLEQLARDLESEEIERNRSRIAEITNFCQHMRTTMHV